jgi:hypothetical protein
MLVPPRPRATNKPRRRSAWYARITVAGLTRRRLASARTVGNASPAASFPWRMPLSRLAPIALAVRPRIS